MTEEEAFLEAIRRDPADETARLVYADWLDDRADPRAEFLRAETRLLFPGTDGPNDPASLARWLELRDRVPAGWRDALGSRVNGLPLPPDLADLLANGGWASAGESDTFACPWGVGAVYAYSLRTMAAETEQVCARMQWLGASDPARPPGDLAPQLAVLIGDEGIGSDAPFALDYRASFGQPRVLLYRWRVASGSSAGNRWVEVAPSFEAFWGQLSRRAGEPGA